MNQLHFLAGRTDDMRPPHAANAVGPPTAGGPHAQRTSRGWIPLLVAAIVLVPPMIADSGCDHAVTGEVSAIRHGDEHCLQRIGANGARIDVDRSGRSVRGGQGVCLAQKTDADELATELNRRWPTLYVDCVDTHRAHPLRFWRDALGFAG